MCHQQYHLLDYVAFRSRAYTPSTALRQYEKELNKAIGLLVGGALAFLVIPIFGLFIGPALLITGAISKKSISDKLSDVNKV